MKSITLKIFAAVFAVICFIFVGCTDGNVGDGSSSDAPTLESSPLEESTPEETPIKGEIFNVTYDLDGGMDGGNPSTYDNSEELKLIVPVRPGYDFAGWTGSGLDEATASVTVPKGTVGDLAFKANWTENGEFSVNVDKNTDDALGKLLLGKARGAIVVNDYVAVQNVVHARRLQDMLLRNDIVIYYVKDSSLEDKNYDFYIYNGITAYEGSRSLADSTGYTEYGVTVNGSSVCVLGWNEASAEIAWSIVNEMIDHVAHGGRLSDFDGAVFKGEVTDMIGADLPRMKDLDSITDVGDGAFQVYDFDSTVEAYNEYLAQLEAAGYFNIPKILWVTSFAQHTSATIQW